jgi:hypothetical protein
MHAAGTVTCDLGDLAEQANATVTITVTPQATGTITNQATVDSAQDDDNAADNTDTEQTVVSGPTGYPRPKGASPLRASLVPTYTQCTSPNRFHGPPLASPSCAPPIQRSQYLTVGTPDANGKASNSVGFVRLTVQPGDPLTTDDEADAGIQLSITDVRRSTDLSDYSGEVELSSVLRVTDRYNGTSGTEAGTVVDFPFPVTIPCSTTADPAIGGTCAITTSYEAVVPGAVPEGKRSVWQVGELQVSDGGADGDVQTLPNTLFARQGVFVP